MRTVCYLIVKDGSCQITHSYKEATSEGVKLIETFFEEKIAEASLSSAERKLRKAQEKLNAFTES